VTSGGAVDTTSWLDRVPGLVQAWYLGQEGGTAVAEVLSGSVNPSGRLPASFERRWEDNPVHASYYPERDGNQVRYQEGVFVGYRGYEQRGVQPQFAFGSGLSYTTFKYEALAIVPAKSADHLYEVSFVVKNTGARAGAAVPQLYVTDVSASVPRPKKELKGFTKLVLQPGESRNVTLPLNARSFAFYDVSAKRWVAEAGKFEVLIGDASDRILLQGSVDLQRDIALQR
jgi:beta-glucosidase